MMVSLPHSGFVQQGFQIDSARKCASQFKPALGAHRRMELTEYQKLWNWANWNWPLLSYEIPNEDIPKIFGANSVLGDKYDGAPGPSEYWLKKLSPSIYVVVQHGIDFDEVIVHSNIFDLATIEELLSLNYPVSWRIPDQELEKIAPNYNEYWSWAVKRVDDNNNIFVVETNLHEYGARELVSSFERKGHKQTYWAENKAPNK